MKNKVVHISDISSVEFDEKYNCLRFYGFNHKNDEILIEERDINNIQDIANILSNIIHSHLLVCNEE